MLVTYISLTIFVLEYVDLYVDYILNKSIYRQFAAFYHGFHSVCASNALIVSTYGCRISRTINLISNGSSMSGISLSASF